MAVIEQRWATRPPITIVPATADFAYARRIGTIHGESPVFSSLNQTSKIISFSHYGSGLALIALEIEKGQLLSNGRWEFEHAFTHSGLSQRLALVSDC